MVTDQAFGYYLTPVAGCLAVRQNVVRQNFVRGNAAYVVLSKTLLGKMPLDETLLGKTSLGKRTPYHKYNIGILYSGFVRILVIRFLSRM
jgi:hypothetical protein